MTVGQLNAVKGPAYCMKSIYVAQFSKILGVFARLERLETSLLINRVTIGSCVQSDF